MNNVSKISCTRDAGILDSSFFNEKQPVLIVAHRRNQSSASNVKTLFNGCMACRGRWVAGTTVCSVIYQ